MKLVIKDDKIFATHNDEQDVYDKYPGMTFVMIDDAKYSELKAAGDVVGQDNPMLTASKGDILTSEKSITYDIYRKKMVTAGSVAAEDAVRAKAETIQTDLNGKTKADLQAFDAVDSAHWD